MKPQQSSRLFTFGLIAVWFMGIVSYPVFNHYTGKSVTPCVFKNVTGKPCTLCGGTRAAMALATLQPAKAIKLNPLATVGMILALVWLIGRMIRKEPYPRVPAPWRTRVTVVVVAAFFLNWIYLWPRL